MGESYLKDQRIQLKLSQEEMADRLGITRVTYSAYERGERELPSRILFSIENITHVPAKEIWEHMGGHIQPKTI